MNNRLDGPTNKPSTVPTPTDMLPLVPTSWANISGSMSIIIVIVVMRVERRCTRVADTAAMAMLMPYLRRSEAYSDSRIAVLLSIPISIISPVCM